MGPVDVRSMRASR